MRLKIMFWFLLFSAGTLYGQSDISFDSISNLSDTNKYKFDTIVAIPKFYYYKIDKNITKCAGISYDYYSVFLKDTLINERLNLWKKTDSVSPLDSNVTFRTDQVMTNFWDSIFYFYSSDSTVKQKLTLHNKGERKQHPVKFNKHPYYTGIIPIPQNLPGGLMGAPWVESLIYDPTGILIKKLEVRHFLESPFKIDNEFFYYNENGELNEYTHLASNREFVLEWDTITRDMYVYSNENILLEWDTITRDMYVYSNPSEHVKITTILTWDSVNSGWVNKKKTETNSNPVGQQISSIDSVWNTTTNTWQEYMKSETEYGSQNEILINTLYSYEPLRNSWIGQSKQEYEYNDSGDIKNVNYYLFDNFYESWYLDNFCVYFYENRPQNTKVKLVTTSDIRVYPNPATNWLTINFGLNTMGEYSIYNIHGQLYLSGKFNNTSENLIDISGLDKGIYIIQIQIKDTGNQVFKFFKR